MGFKVLGFDASGPDLAVGYLDGTATRADWWWDQPRSAGTRLVSWISQMVLEFGRPDGLAVGIGPGSFTGVRIAVAAAKAYAMAWQVPVLGISSLQAWASQVPVGERVLVTSERRGTAFYAGYYWNGPKGPEPLWTDTAIDGDLPEIFPVTEPIAVIGPLTEMENWQQRVGPRAYAVNVPLTGSAVARLASGRLQLGQSSSPLALAPAYIRPPAITRAGSSRNT